MKNLRGPLTVACAITVALGTLGVTACEDSNTQRTTGQTNTQPTYTAPAESPRTATEPTGANAPQQQADYPNNPGDTNNVDQPAGAPPPAAAPAPAGGLAANDPSKLDDAQIAAVVIALNTGEIQEAQLAQTKAKSQDVKAFAAHMIKAHTAMLDKGTKDFKASNLTPVDTTVSNDLRNQASMQLSSLQGENGKSFDDTYINGQVKAHQDALNMVDQLLTAAKDSKLHADLLDARTHIERHLRIAENIRDGVKPGNTNMQKPGNANRVFER
jgi:putative membrane protein